MRSVTMLATPVETSDLYYPGFFPNASNVFVTGFSCHFSSCSAKCRDSAAALSLQGCSPILSIPNHTWDADVLMEQMCVGSPVQQGCSARL